jgi:DNA-binding CsgD family transcriptional regulator
VENLGAKELRDILRIVEIASSTPDRERLGHEVLDAVASTVGVDKCMFVLQEDEGTAPAFFFRGIDSEHAALYLSHFHSQDPLRLVTREAEGFSVLSAAGTKRSTVSLEEAVPYSDFVRTDYYREFYRPQGILYEIATRLETPERLCGVIDLLRSPEDQTFSPREIELMDALAPHLAAAIEAAELRREARIKESALALYEARTEEALLLCDELARIVYVNDRSRALLEELTGQAPSSTLPEFMREDLNASRDRASLDPKAAPVPLARRSVHAASGEYEFVYEASPGLAACWKQPLYSVSIRKCAEPGTRYEDVLNRRFGLTWRESQIVGKIFEGKTNAEIGDQLFISECTVKKHLQNICEKLKVNSRTAILSTVLRELDPSAAGCGLGARGRGRS